MDLSSRIYIEYLFDKNRCYDDKPIEKEFENTKNNFVESLTDVQVSQFNEFLRISKKLRTCQDLHLIDFVMKYLKK